MSPQPRPPLGVTCKPSDKWRVSWDPNDIWPSQWVAWRENDMWHPRPSCSPWRPVRSVKKDAKGKDNSVKLISCCCLFFSVLGGFVFKGTLLNCSKDAWLNKTYEKKQIVKCDIGSKSKCEKINGQELWNLDLDLDLPKYVLQRVITKSLTTHHESRWFCLFHHFWHLCFVFSFRNVSTGLSCSTPGESKGRSEAPVKTPASPDSPWQHSQWTSLGNDVGVPIRRGVRSNCPGVFFCGEIVFFCTP